MKQIKRIPSDIKYRLQELKACNENSLKDLTIQQLFDTGFKGIFDSLEDWAIEVVGKNPDKIEDFLFCANSGFPFKDEIILEFEYVKEKVWCFSWEI